MLLTQKVKLELTETQEAILTRDASSFTMVTNILLNMYELDRIARVGGEPAFDSEGKKYNNPGIELPDNLYKESKELCPTPLPSAVVLYTRKVAEGLFKTYKKNLMVHRDSEGKNAQALVVAREANDQRKIDKLTHKLKKMPPKVPQLKKILIRADRKAANIKKCCIEFPTRDNETGKIVRLNLKAFIPEDMYEKFARYKTSAITLVKQEKFWMAYIPVDIPNESIGETFTNTMGVDLNLRCPAVIYTSTGKFSFIGNGRETRYKRNRFNVKRKQRALKCGKVKKSSKESNWMKNVDHHVSKAIVKFAIDNEIGIIKFEDLTSLKDRTNEVYRNKGRKRIVKTWTYGQVIDYVSYKAQRVGIKVEFVDPKFTSQICPDCGEITKMNQQVSRSYLCSSCGYTNHLDKVAAINILNAVPIKKRGGKKKEKVATT